MVRINTSVNGSSWIQKLTGAVRRGCPTWGMLDDAGCGSRSSLVIASVPPPTGRIGPHDFGQNPLNRPIVSEITDRQALRLFAHRARALPAHVAGLEAIELKAGVLDQRSDRAVEVAAAAQALPDRGQPILPPHDVWIRRSTVFDE